MQLIIEILVLCALVRTAISTTLSLESSDNLKESVAIPPDYVAGCEMGDESLDLSEMDLNHIRSKILRSKTVDAINLKNNNIKEIPHHAFKDVSDLECLDISGNNIPTEKFMDFGHPTLAVLNLAYQHNEVPKREWLDSREDASEALETTIFSSFPNLQFLDLSGNKFYSLPRNFSTVVPKLSHLYLTNRRITDLSEHIFPLLPQSLKSLHLENNNINIVDYSRDLTMEALFFDGNPLFDEGHYLQSSTLKTLSLSNCTLFKIQNILQQQPYQYNYRYMYPTTRAHESINLPGNVPNLENLDLSWNRLHNIYDLLHLSTYKNLKRLSLSHNNFQQFPVNGTFPRLEFFSLSYNKISVIPNEIKPFPSLKELNLRGNEIRNIEPGAFVNMLLLETLDLSYNRIESLPAKWFQPLLNLQHLDLRHNRFANIPDMFGELPMNYNIHLKHIYVKSNSLQKIAPNQLEYLPPSSVLHVC